MRENFLHYIWKQHLLPKDNLQLSNGDTLQIISVGEYNTLSGPDFVGAHLKIGSQEWAGNVEIHTRSSQWYAHGHEKDSAYGNVILHVVWQHDVEVFDAQHNIIPTLELQTVVSKDIITQYQALLHQPTQFIQCENQLLTPSLTFWKQWKETLFLERLKEKSTLIFNMLQETQNDWEAVFFRMLMRYFGGNINGEVFEKGAKSIPFTVIRKELHNAQALEALLLGQMNLLSDNYTDTYYKNLQHEYQYQQHKYQLTPVDTVVQFFKLRPPNFPTIRLSQLAQLYHKEKTLFAKCLALFSIDQWQTLLMDVTTSEYWKTHYTFAKESATKTKKISKLQSELLWINVIIPMQYTYQMALNEQNDSVFFEKMKNVPAEENAILSGFQKKGIKINNAFESQALLQLYKNYCLKNECLRCQIGTDLLKRRIAI